MKNILQTEKETPQAADEVNSAAPASSSIENGTNDQNIEKEPSEDTVSCNELKVVV